MPVLRKSLQLLTDDRHDGQTDDTNHSIHLSNGWRSPEEGVSTVRQRTDCEVVGKSRSTLPSPRINQPLAQQSPLRGLSSIRRFHVHGLVQWGWDDDENCWAHSADASLTVAAENELQARRAVADIFVPRPDCCWEFHQVEGVDE